MQRKFLSMDLCYQALNCPAKPIVSVSCCFLALIPGFPGVLFKSALPNALGKARQSCRVAVGHLSELAVFVSAVPMQGTVHFECDSRNR